ncbi:uncharacterized protein UTRI_00337 [Ustilago trichophora]|uniref:Uncharacterized protein n=1 Tax=Ustilago trichophora TaxID=86804 RepID=A0A5C3DT90_9BASI|nr:uncharacterized protein UTRI_00337 [Ustilago trichophora]
MHTLPAAKVVGHDFLGNHIGELLIRQPVKRAAPAPRNKTSSNGSTVCGSDNKTLRRSSVASLDPVSTASSASNTSDVQSATAALDSFLSVGAVTPLGTSADPVASLENGSESSASEPSSVDSRSGSADATLHLHLDQLSLSHKRLASEGAPKSPRVSFVTNFGARPRRSGSRRAPSEAGSSSYFGMSSAMSSHMSSASLSPMEPSGGISWNLPFREQHPSFAQAVEHNASLNRNPSQQSSTSGAASSSQPSKPPTPPSGLDAEPVTPTSASGLEAASNGKSQSFSAVDSTQPVRQRLTRAATESTLNTAAQMQQHQRPLKSPGASSGLSGSGLSHSNSMGATTSALRTHRKKPSLIPKGDDERTFCFVDASSSDAEFDDVLVEEPTEAPNTMATLPLARSASDTSYREVVDVQHSAHTRACSEQSKASKKVADAMQSATPTPTIEAPSPSGLAMAADTSEEQGQQNDTLRISQWVTRDQNTPQHSSAFPIKPLSLVSQAGVSRPARRLRIQPNVQSRPSLLEKTMEEQRRASRQAKATSTSAVPAEAVSPAVTPSASEKVPESPGAKAALANRYDPIAYGAGQRTFRINSPAAAVVGGFDFPFSAISSDERDKAGQRANPPASHARTSDWARAQSLLASSPPAHDLCSRTSQPDSYVVDMRTSCHPMSDFDDTTSSSSTPLPPAPSTALLRHHTASHSSGSTESPSILDTRELDLLSPPETAISTPELESPPEHALDSLEKAGVGSGRRSSPLSS